MSSDHNLSEVKVNKSTVARPLEMASSAWVSLIEFVHKTHMNTASSLRMPITIESHGFLPMDLVQTIVCTPILRSSEESWREFLMLSQRMTLSTCSVE